MMFGWIMILIWSRNAYCKELQQEFLVRPDFYITNLGYMKVNGWLDC